MKHYIAIKTTITDTQINIREVWFKYKSDFIFEYHNLIKKEYKIKYIEKTDDVVFNEIGLCVLEKILKL